MLITGYLCSVDERSRVAGEQGNQGGEGGGRDRAGQFRGERTEKGRTSSVKTSVADPDPGSGAFLIPGSGIPNPYF
jgi:hypothetical protein